MVRCSGYGLVHSRHWCGVLPNVPSSGRHGAIHSNSIVVAAMPLAPAVSLGGFDVGSVVTSQDVGKRSGTERPGVVFVGTPGREQHRVDGLHDLGIISKSEASPFLRNRLPGEIGIPCQTSEP